MFIPFKPHLHIIRPQSEKSANTSFLLATALCPKCKIQFIYNNIDDLPACPECGGPLCRIDI